VLQLLCCETTTALLIPPSASKVCPKELVLHLPRTNRRRVVGRNTNEPTGHPHSSSFFWLLYLLFLLLVSAIFFLKSKNNLIVSSFFFLLYRGRSLGWHFQMLFQSSSLKARTSLFAETWQMRLSSFELWAFKNVTANGIGCIFFLSHSLGCTCSVSRSLFLLVP